MTRDLPKALLLATWLWLPSLAVLSTDHLQDGDEVFALLAFSLFLLAAPLTLVPRIRLYFLLWSPLALLVPLYCYLTLAYGSVPGDALLSAALHTSPSMSWQVVTSFGWRIWLVPAALLAYLMLAQSLNRDWRLAPETRKRLLALLLLIAMLALVGRQTVAQRLRLPPLFEQSTANLAFPSGLALSLARLARHAAQPGGFVSVHGRPAAGGQPLLVVLVVGESLRSDHLGLNGYARDTTPRLAALGPDLLSFPDVASTGNWTEHAVPGIVSLRLGAQRASVLQTFAEAGYRTAWLSNQEAFPYSRTADVAEHAIDAQDFHLRTDANLLPMFTSFVRQAGPRQLVVLHMIGSHIPYEERYTAASRVFTPTLGDGGIKQPLPADKQAAINSYDNTVIETDKFLARVIEVLRGEQRPAIVLFTSDHGENLFDDERHLFMHAQKGPTRYDTHVPLLAWMNPPYRAAYPAVAQALHANRLKKIGHASLFPSLLDIGAVSWDGRDARNSFAAPEYIEGKRDVAIDLYSDTPYDSLK
ncbi:phosphoethanolamine transferase [Duganella sp. CT11-25]|uniref:phosphoethanolamine transferase n=1 Tax=unclassified Duganella TaxID=2636909 RepID=UPI0039B0C761